ncbi:MAG TPA: glucose-1-phosphate thymidylyltransferase [bacterium]|nr:glucose-1-phosphate thymidylyltransferase [bacterium]
MKGLILSGGKGTRLRPITHTRAKQLIPVANKPILFFGIEAMREAGVRDIGIVVGDTADEVMAAVGSGKRFGVKVSYIRQQAPLGLAHAVKISADYLGDSPFVMYLGDNLIANGITDLVKKFQKNAPDAMILLAKVEHPERFGVAELKAGRVARLSEKPKKPRSDLALVGVYMFTSKIMKAVNSIRPSARGELEITDAIQWMVERGLRVEPHLVEGWWKDTGRVEDLLEANRIVLDKQETSVKGTVDKESQVEFKVVIEKGARVSRSVIRGPAIIGAGARIENSYLGPFTSIDEGCRIEGSEIEHSIVLAGSVVRNMPRRIEDSLIGRDAVLECSRKRPEALRFVLGENSQVDLT